MTSKAITNMVLKKKKVQVGIKPGLPTRHSSLLQLENYERHEERALVRVIKS
jgi:hypothetical protein